MEKSDIPIIERSGRVLTAGSAMYLAANLVRGFKGNLFAWGAWGLMAAGNVVIAKWGRHKIALQAVHGLKIGAAYCLYKGEVSGGASASLLATGHAAALGLSVADGSNGGNKAAAKFRKIFNWLVQNRTLVAGSLSFTSRFPFIQKKMHETIETIHNAASLMDPAIEACVLMDCAVLAFIIGDFMFCLGKAQAAMKKPDMAALTLEAPESLETGPVPVPVNLWADFVRRGMPQRNLGQMGGFRRQI